MVCSVLLLLMAGPSAWAQGQAGGHSRVGQSPHNMSATGPGAFRSLSVRQVCVFCHTPHAAKPNAPMWNRDDVGQTYIQYSSSSLISVPGQPQGSSRLCLACHDGTVALESMKKLPDPAQVIRSDRRLTGRSNLGTDLSNDHPISIAYDAALFAASGQLAHPNTVPLPLEDGMIRCGTCHEPHDNTMQPFLRLPSINGELCTACHQPAGTDWSWEASAHANSPRKPRGAQPWKDRKPQWRGQTVAENSCQNCHAPHNAATPQRLINDVEEATCYRCHDGRTAESDIQGEFLKPSNHPVNISPNPDHDLAWLEPPLQVRLHVECGDCHNPHAVRSDDPMITVDASRPGVTSAMKRAPEANSRIIGVSASGAGSFAGQEIENQYELCFRCHGQPGLSSCGTSRCSTAEAMTHTRSDGVYNLRDKLDPTDNPGLVSYHPVVQNDPFNNNGVDSLRLELGLNPVSTLIYCTDCHNGDESRAGTGSGAEGPHGSLYPPILAQRYTLRPYFLSGGTSHAEAALCYKCHDPSRLLGSSSGSGELHRSHLEYGSCITCHDPHGSEKLPHLLNFGTRNNLARSGDSPLITGAGAFFEPTWFRTADGGKCWLQCHSGGEHLGWSYPRSMADPPQTNPTQTN